jgi:putative transposase
MDNHVHLLVTPTAVGAMSRMMQKLGRQYLGQFNACHRCTGTLWEGRCKSCLVDSESCVPCCYRYIDLNPVRARMTDDPIRFPWSSCAANCGQRSDPLLQSHPAYAALGHSSVERATAYQVLLREVLSDDDLLEVRTYLQQQRALGRDDFRAMVEAKTRRFAGIRPAHRPARDPSPG